MTARLRLAFVYPSFAQRGGAETHLLLTMQGLAERGHHIDLFTSTYNEKLHLSRTAVRFHVDPLGGRGFMEGVGGTVRMIRLLSTRLRGYDLAIAGSFPATVWSSLGNHGTPVAWLCMEPKRNLYPREMYAEAPGTAAHGYRTRAEYGSTLLTLLRDPHVLLPYQWRALAQRTLDRFAVQRIPFIFANSPYIADKVRHIYKRAYVHITWAPIRVPQPYSAAFEPLILAPTRLEPIKNVDAVLNAVQRLVQQDALNGYSIWIVGTGSDADRLQARAVSLGLTAFVRFTGYLPYNELVTAYDRCAFVVYPSLAEPLGLPVGEAGLAGKAVIADKHGGPATLVEHGVTGLLVDAQDPQEIAQAISRLIKRPDEAIQMGKAAKKRLEPILGLPHWIEHFEQVLCDCVQRTRK